MSESFDYAVQFVLRHEGGYVNDPSDPGGETHYGISKRSYPDLDIANLTEREAKEIYHRDFWLRYGYENLSPPVACKVLDMAVNMGPEAAHKCLQRALHACGCLHVAVDGIIGPQTLQAASEVSFSNLLCALRAEASWHYRRLIELQPRFAKYERGWLKRAYS